MGSVIMKTWTTTSWIYRTFGQKEQTNDSGKRWSDGVVARRYFTPDYNNLQKMMIEVADFCNREQMTLKAVLPLTSAQTLEYGQTVEYSSFTNGVVAAAGIGQGWGFSNVVGFAAFLERVEQIPDEEYERRCNNNVSVAASPSVAPPPLPAEAL
jgi:hypothetical protein